MPPFKILQSFHNANRDDTNDLHRLVDDFFVHLQERLISELSGPAAFKMLPTDNTDYFDAALETLQKFGVRTGTPFSSYLRAFRAFVASTVEKDGPLVPSLDMAIELVRIRTAMLFPGELATEERPYSTLVSM